LSRSEKIDIKLQGNAARIRSLSKQRRATPTKISAATTYQRY